MRTQFVALPIYCHDPNFNQGSFALTLKIYIRQTTFKVKEITVPVWSLNSMPDGVPRSGVM